MRIWVFLAAGLALASCSKPAQRYERYADEAVKVNMLKPPPGTPGAPAPQGGQSGQIAVSVPMLAYSYAYQLELPAAQIRPLLGRHEAACVAAGPTVCQVTGSSVDSQGHDIASGRLEMRAAPEWLRTFRAGLEGDAKASGGRIESSSTQTEDLTRSIVDTEATLRAKTTLRDRLEKLLAERPGKLSELLELEQNIAQVQGEIDATQSELAVMRTRVATSKLSLSYQAKGVAAPEGVASPLKRAIDGFLGNTMMVVAALLTLASFLLPIAIIVAPIAWLLMRGRKRKPGRAKPPSAP